jgi:DNA polymerase-3 subunit delta'
MIDLLDIVGQDVAIGTIQRMLGGRRRAHGLLFVGPEGVGRRTTGVALAATLLCGQPRRQPNAGRLADLAADAPLRRPCGQCADCRMMAAGTHPDFHLVYKELARYHENAAVRGRVMQDLGIPVIKAFLLDPAYRAAARGRGKVFVVREAELMSADAQNALLKTLEEPPPGVTIVLLCRDAASLLPTTLSRTWPVRFGPLPADFIRGKLAEAGVGEQEAAFWAVFTDGSAGRALRLAAAGMYAMKTELLDKLAGAVAGRGTGELADLLVRQMEDLAAKNVAEVKEAEGADMAKTLASRRAAALLLELMGAAFRDALTVASGAGRELAHADQRQVIDLLTRRFGPAELAEVLEQLAQYEELLWRNVNPKTVWDNVAVSCAFAAPLRV